MKSIMPLVAVALTLALATPPVVAVATEPAEVSIVTTVDRPTGATVRQTATVTDTGRLPLTDLRIRLDLAHGCERSVVLLLPGDTVTVSCTGRPGDTDRVVTATVSGHDALGRRVTARSTTTLRLPHPAVRLGVTAAPAQAVPGQPVNYTASVTNSGDVPLHGLAVTAAGLPSCDRSVPGLAPGASAVVTCTATAGELGRSTEFRVSGRDTSGDLVDATASVDVDVVVPGLVMTLSGPPGRAQAGHDAAITVRITDTSTVALADLRITGTPAACVNDLSWLAGGDTVSYTCPTAVGARTVVALMVTSQPAVDGIPLPGADCVTGNSTLVLLPAAPLTPEPTTPPTTTTPAPSPAPTKPPPPIAAVAPMPLVPSPSAPPVPTPVPAPTVAPPSTAAAPAPVPAAPPPRPPVTEQATGPLGNPGRTAAVIAVLAVLVMTVSVGALAAATRPGK